MVAHRKPRSSGEQVTAAEDRGIAGLKKLDRGGGAVESLISVCRDYEREPVDYPRAEDEQAHKRSECRVSGLHALPLSRSFLTNRTIDCWPLVRASASTFPVVGSKGPYATNWGERPRIVVAG